MKQVKNKFEKAYEQASREMKKGSIVYCSKCDEVLPKDKKLFVQHIELHEN